MISSISDIHILEDQNKETFERFCRNELVINSRTIVLLGDIFELMVGYLPIYFEKYSFFFQQVEKWLRLGKNIVFIEGNHDFHLSRLFRVRYPVHYSTGQLRVCDCHWDTQVGVREWIFIHGDQLDKKNIGYQRYRMIIRSFFAKQVADYFLTQTISDKVESVIRSRNQRKTKDYSIVPQSYKSKWQQIQNELLKEATNSFVFGHSHIPAAEQNNSGMQVMNSGFSPASQKFVFIDQLGIGTLVDL